MPKHGVSREERAQVLPIMAILLVVFIGLIGMAIDIGRMYVARTELSRAVDAAALAGVVELPNMTNAQTKATAYLHDNQSDVTASFPAPAADYQFIVKGTRHVDMLFMGIFGFGELTSDGQATAGFGVVPADIVMAIDATGSMGASPCNEDQDNAGCPIYEARTAASDFADSLLGSGSTTTLVGLNPYRGCYNPPRTYSACVSTSMLVNLSSNQSSVLSQISGVLAQGGTGTNNCLGLYQADSILMGTGHHTEANTLRFIVILTDGDNTYNNNSYGNGAPPTTCRPDTDPGSSDGDTSSSCTSAQTRERELDNKTQSYANTLKAAGVEIYVVGFGVCGTSSTTTCNTALIGNTDHDNTADRNLLKCIASSHTGTNDHYFETSSATELPGLFQTIAGQIAFRLIE
jgi:hypothetical protein